MLDRIGTENSKLRVDISFSLVNQWSHLYGAKQLAIATLLHLVLIDNVKVFLAKVHCEPEEISKDRCLLHWDSCKKNSGYTIDGTFYFEVLGSLRFFNNEGRNYRRERFERTNFYRVQEIILEHYLTEDLQRRKEFRTQKEAIHHLRRSYPSVRLPDYVIESLFNCITNEKEDSWSD